MAKLKNMSREHTFLLVVTALFILTVVFVNGNTGNYKLIHIDDDDCNQVLEFEFEDPIRGVDTGIICIRDVSLPSATDNLVDDVTTMMETLPPGDYIVGPDVLDMPMSAQANDTTIATSVVFTEDVTTGEELEVSLSWNEVGGVQGVPPTNEIELTISINGDTTTTTLSGDGDTTPTYTEPGDYKFTLTGKQGTTQYDIAFTGTAASA